MKIIDKFTERFKYNKIKYIMKELGVEKYLVNAIDDNLGHFLLVGLYSSEDAFNNHVNSIHVQTFLSAVPDLVEENTTYVATPLNNDSDPKSSIDPS